MSRALLIFAVLLCATAAARLAEIRTAAPAPPEHGAAQESHASHARVASISRDADGHFRAQALINGRAVWTLVDTGASVVALTRADAQRVGADLSELVFDQPVMTANGEVSAARLTLSQVSVGGVEVREVEALVAPGGLETSLLGMSYLGALSRFEASPRALTLYR